MSINNYLKDKIVDLLILFISLIIVISLLFLFNINTYLIILISIILLINCILVFLYDYFRKRTFYNELDKSLAHLDKKYLINEIIKEPNFLEGKIFYESFYTINKYMCEEINKYKFSSNEFREYLELWCHEIKTPVATSTLIIDNNKNKVTESIKEEIDKIDYYIEQVLYYARIKEANTDYIITNTNLKNIINEVIKKNKKTIISKKIKIKINNIYNVYSDSKWLSFIINQIVINSVKYSKDKNSYISIYMEENKNNKILYIEDNGIGIDKSDLSKVFLKGFTGKNGRGKYKSTGIGLYLCKNLCNKLGHDIKIESIKGNMTKVMIIFPNSSLIKEVK